MIVSVLRLLLAALVTRLLGRFFPLLKRLWRVIFR